MCASAMTLRMSVVHIGLYGHSNCVQNLTDKKHMVAYKHAMWISRDSKLKQCKIVDREDCKNVGFKYFYTCK